MSASEGGYRDTPLWKAYDWVAQALDHLVGWDKLPKPIGLMVLVGLRNILRQKNLYDTNGEARTAPQKIAPFASGFLTSRTADGSYNDLSDPTMGMAGNRFGRNVPLTDTYPDPMPLFMEPNPRIVSRELMTRHQFTPATTVNLLAASWIQFMVKDWFSHGQGDPNRVWELAVAPDDPWFQRPMQILKTLEDPTRPSTSKDPPTFANFETPWWDASQIYGTTPDEQAMRRTHVDGKLAIGADGLLELPEDPRLNPALTPGWWLGLNMMSTIFIREHNSVCNALKADYPTWSDDELFGRARLVIAGLMAKIHTTEWTPAIICHPTSVAGLQISWWGVASEKVRRAFDRISRGELVSGIPGSNTDQYGVPYSLTEEFSIVYRMHPLIPDDFSFRSAIDDRTLAEKTFRDISGPAAQEVTAEINMADLFYTFGTSHPGAIILNNFPKFLQEFQRPDHPDVFMDLAATDILRTREFGIPRYNQFRRLLHLKAARSFHELTADPAMARKLEDIYGDVEKVDLIVGMFAEKRPTGFAFSDTAFRIFILMASRRLNSDRFFTSHFKPEVYTQAGYDWVQGNSMISVLLRHFPGLRPAMANLSNAFQPWAPATNVTKSE